jgi:hypothetical protein
VTDTTKLDGLIVRNIADIEAAYNRATDEMEAVLGKETAKLFERKFTAQEWEGSHDVKLCDGKGEQWTAPIEWRSTASDSEEYDLFIGFGCQLGLDGYEASWLGHFAGIRGSGIQLQLQSNTLHSKGLWKKFLKTLTDQVLLSKLREEGFTVNNELEYPLALRVNFELDTLAKAFEDEDFHQAFRPLEISIDTVVGLRDILDELVIAIRAFKL